MCWFVLDHPVFVQHSIIRWTHADRCSEITGSLFKARLVDQRFFLASDLVLFSHKLKPDIFFFSIRVLGN